MSDINVSAFDGDIDRAAQKKKNDELIVKVTWAFASFSIFFALVTLIWMFESELPDGFWFGLIFG